jgi:hypothetical protein
MLEPTPLLLAALAISVAAVVAAFAGAVRVPQPVSA